MACPRGGMATRARLRQPGHSGSKEAPVLLVLVGFRSCRGAAVGADVFVQISGRKDEQQPFPRRRRLPAGGAEEERGAKRAVLRLGVGSACRRWGCVWTWVLRGEGPPLRLARHAGTSSHGRILIKRPASWQAFRPGRLGISWGDAGTRASSSRPWARVGSGRCLPHPPGQADRLNGGVDGQTAQQTVQPGFSERPQVRRMQEDTQGHVSAHAQANGEHDPFPDEGTTARGRLVVDVTFHENIVKRSAVEPQHGQGGRTKLPPVLWRGTGLVTAKPGVVK